MKQRDFFLHFLILLSTFRSTYAVPRTTPLPTTIEAEETVSPPATTTAKPAKTSPSSIHETFIDHHRTTGHHGFVDHTQPGYPSFAVTQLPTAATYFEPRSPVVYRSFTEPTPSLGNKGYFDPYSSGTHMTFTAPPPRRQPPTFDPPRQVVRHFVYIEPASSGGYGGFTGPPPMSGGFRTVTESPSYGGYRGYTELFSNGGQQVFDIPRHSLRQQTSNQIPQERFVTPPPPMGSYPYFQSFPSRGQRSFVDVPKSIGQQSFNVNPPSVTRQVLPERLPQVSQEQSFTRRKTVRQRPSIVAQEAVRYLLSSTAKRNVPETISSVGRPSTGKQFQSKLPVQPSPSLERQAITVTPRSISLKAGITTPLSRMKQTLNKIPPSKARHAKIGSPRSSPPVGPRPKTMVEPPPSAGSLFGECLIFQRYQQIPNDYECMKGRRAMYCRYLPCPPVADFPCVSPRRTPGEKCLSCPGMCVFNGEIIPADPEPLPSLDMVNQCVCTKFGLQCTKKRARDLQAFCAV